MTAVDFGGGEEIRFERIGVAGVITLTRPDVLNALSHGMIRAMLTALAAWRDDPGVELVIIKGEGRAFCAGGDVRSLYDSRQNPRIDYFADEYRLNHEIERFPKPYVALIDGIVMGGGVGVSCHGSHRVMTENAVFAMPEVGIGFFPDVGASHLLPDLADNFGLYLGLTASRIKWGDAFWSGLATHPVKAADLGAAFSMLARDGNVEQTLRNFFAMPRRETEQEVWGRIDGWFDHSSVEDIVASIEADGADPVAAELLATLRAKSPTSLKVACRQLRAGQTLSMADCMRMEYRIVNRMLYGPDLYEGIRAVIIDKDHAPEWRPPRLDMVSESAVDAYFAPLPGGELQL